jgi:monoamine oxidase
MMNDVETVDTIVIGAGMSGVTAARLLAQAGHRVVLLEGRDRIGGRTWTDDAIGVPVDLGASWIHGIDGNPLTALRDALGIDSVEFTMGSFQAGGRPVAYHAPDGARLDPVAQERWLADLEVVDERLAHVTSTSPTGTTYAAAVEQVLAELTALPGLPIGGAEPVPAWNPERVERIREYMRHRVEDLCGAWIDDLDAHGLDEEHVAGDEVVFPRGYGQFASALVDGLDVRLGDAVARIARDADGVTVTTGGGAEFRAANVVATMPLGVLQAGDVVFEPPLPEPVAGAIARLGMGTYDKVFLRFDTKFWDDVYVVRQQGPAGADWHSWYDMSRATGQPILAALTGGPSARRLEALTDAEIVAEAVAALRRMYGDAVPDPIAFRITRWGEDEFSRGSYSYLAAGADVDDPDLVATPIDGRLHLAGEATFAEEPATVHGAMLSGHRAAERILGRPVDLGTLSDPVRGTAETA